MFFGWLLECGCGCFRELVRARHAKTTFNSRTFPSLCSTLDCTPTEQPYLTTVSRQYGTMDCFLTAIFVLLLFLLPNAARHRTSKKKKTAAHFSVRVGGLPPSFQAHQLVEWLLLHYGEPISAVVVHRDKSVTEVLEESQGHVTEKNWRKHSKLFFVNGLPFTVRVRPSTRWRRTPESLAAYQTPRDASVTDTWMLGADDQRARRLSHRSPRGEQRRGSATRRRSRSRSRSRLSGGLSQNASPKAALVSLRPSSSSDIIEAGSPVGQRERALDSLVGIVPGRTSFSPDVGVAGSVSIEMATVTANSPQSWNQKPEECAAESVSMDDSVCAVISFSKTSTADKFINAYNNRRAWMWRLCGKYQPPT